MAAGELSQAPAGALRWELLESQPPSGERLTARLAVPSSRDDVFIALDAARRRYVLVAIPPGEPRELAERISRGVDVRTLEMNTGTGALQPYVEIACLETQGHAALDTIALEIIAALQAGASIGRIRLVQNVLAKWRRFWSGVSQGLLSKEQQLGLFGELWFLCRWLAPAVGAPRALRMWRGPTGARSDFEVRGVGIEAKTSGRLDAAHVVHGLEQLLEPPGGSLFLFSLCVRDEASGTESLPRMVDEARRLLAEDFAALSQFESAVAVVGYDDRLAAEYAKFVLRIREEGLYRVADGFPRLIPASLNAGLPPGVSAVTYELRLDAAANWLVARTPAAAATLLNDFAK